VKTPYYASYPSLQDRTVFVSGGATGLGEELVRQFTQQGAKVAFADIDDDSASRLCDDVEAGCGRRPLYLPADVRDIPGYMSAIQEAGHQFGTISVLVNNAANDQRRDSDQVDLEFWNDKLAVNLSHHFFAVQAVASGMRTLGGVSIINLGSVSVHIPLTSVAPYVASKAAIEGLTRTLARELGESPHPGQLRHPGLDHDGPPAARLGHTGGGTAHRVLTEPAGQAPARGRRAARPVAGGG
jgi:NAD(P)-dependent dehydrogenase (short-subunit alcohol dehydrogenase family)